jgi:hypothetical protein
MGLLRLVIAIGMGIVIWRVSIFFIRMIATPPPAVDPNEVVEVDQDFRCSVCGAEITMKWANINELVPPRHCREDMVPTGS